jgi:hypothetical protein
MKREKQTSDAQVACATNAYDQETSGVSGVMQRIRFTDFLKNLSTTLVFCSLWRFFPHIKANLCDYTLSVRLFLSLNSAF